jgi:predicted transcriptional regulator
MVEQLLEPKRRVSRRRDALQIIGDFLDAVSRAGREGSPPTALMYKANLSWIMLVNVARECVKAGWVTEHDVTLQYQSKKKRVVYRITEDGQRVRDNYKELKEEVDPVYKAVLAAQPANEEGAGKTG